MTDIAPADEHFKPKLRSHPFVRFGLRGLLSISMMWLLIQALPEVKFSDLGPQWHSGSAYWLVGAAAAKFTAFCFSTLRWGYVIDALAKKPRYLRLLSHFLAGQFVSNLLPTAFGGDVVRVSRLGNDLDDNPRAFASVAIDRLTGWLVLPLISIAAIAVQPGLQHVDRATGVAMAINIATLIGLTGMLIIAANRRFARDIDSMTGWKRFFVAIHLGIDALRKDRRNAADVIGVGIVFQVTQSLAVWMAARAIGLDAVTAGAALAFFPPSAIVQNIPLGVGGLGVREGAFLLFFGALGADPALTITLGLLVYLLTLGTSALGAPSFILGGGAPVQTSQDTGDESTT